MSSRIEQIIEEIEEYVDSCKFQQQRCDPGRRTVQSRCDHRRRKDTGTADGYGK